MAARQVADCWGGGGATHCFNWSHTKKEREANRDSCCKIQTALFTCWLPPEAGIAGVYAPGTPVVLGAAGATGVKVGCGIAGACLCGVTVVGWERRMCMLFGG